MRRLTAAFAASAAIAVFATGCNTQMSAADGANEQVCAAMTQAQQAVAGLKDNPPTTVAQAQEQLTEVSASITTAKESASGLAQAILTNLDSSLSSANKSLSGLPADGSLPNGFTGTVNGISSKVDEVTTKLECGQ